MTNRRADETHQNATSNPGVQVQLEFISFFFSEVQVLLLLNYIPGVQVPLVPLFFASAGADSAGKFTDAGANKALGRSRH